MSTSAEKTGCAIIGSGNIGTDLMIKILRSKGSLDLKMMIGIDPESDGLARANRMGVETSDKGIEGLLKRLDVLDQVSIVFDATSARAHHLHAAKLREHGKLAIDLTPASIGPYVVPPVNLGQNMDSENVNMITCGGQATIPIVSAISRVATVRYAEMVSSISSKSAGPGTRQNIGEFTRTTARGLEVIGGAEMGKAIIILNPAEPPLIMRNTVYACIDQCDRNAVEDSIHAMVASVQEYVPGYRLKSDPVFDELRETPLFVPGSAELKVTVLLEVSGAADYLPEYAGNLDIMTAAALRVGELFAEGNRN